MFKPASMETLLSQSVGDLLDAGNPDLLDRWSPVSDWMETRLSRGLDASCKSTAARVGPRVVGRDRAGRGIAGINLAMQDALSLASHPAILTAVSAAGRRFGVHAAGSAAQMGLSTLTTTLEERLAMFLGCDEAVVFPCGWTAGYGTLRTLLRAGDHALVIGHPRECLREGAASSGARVQMLDHGDAEGLEQRLEWLRDTDPHAGILVVVPALSLHEQSLPDLPRLQRLCRRYAATLLVDVSHDLGMTGETGRGVLEMQRMIGRVDIVLGSFSRAFASNGGFVASRHAALKVALRLHCAAQFDSNAMSPLQAAAALAALDVIASDEGAERRDRLAANARRLRDGLEAAGLATLGQPGPVVTVALPRVDVARQLTAELLAQGALVNLDERPGFEGAVWPLKPMADHEATDIDTFLQTLRAARLGLIEAEERHWLDRYASA
ncbi:aminotransferase class I/II-fold pyridoxal phosphate-dependent enzyme [Gemmobacter serpentinus]|uniref:aminotransferase class I/II-fold pyridoxal phosphate-dependent enzyme n=1 Tax=Gemmobacter serpentinus TaxID=2652247 RepID=UPI00124C9D8A|nr:aminotransferase class I/II-fold pyridoxal phosphate-dependent enzyme [Gemmobacter serpentinus]